MGRTKGVVDVEDLKPARLHGGGELINERCILEARDSRLRGQRFAALWTTSIDAFSVGPPNRHMRAAPWAAMAAIKESCHRRGHALIGAHDPKRTL
jgi:hypothetical protein